MTIAGSITSRLAPEQARPALAGQIGLSRQSEYLVRPGERPEHLHLLIDGWAARYRLLCDGRRQITALFLPGDLCDLAWLRDEPAPYHVLALSPIRSVQIPLAEVTRLAQTQPWIMAPLLQEALAQARLQTEWLVGVGRLTAIERIARLLLEVAERSGMDRARQGQCVFPLTQLDMADATGLTAVHVNRTLQLLRAQDLVELGNRRLRIRDVEALQKIAFVPAGLIDRALKAKCQRLVRVAPRG